MHFYDLHWRPQSNRLSTMKLQRSSCCSQQPIFPGITSFLQDCGMGCARRYKFHRIHTIGWSREEEGWRDWWGAAKAEGVQTQGLEGRRWRSVYGVGPYTSPSRQDQSLCEPVSGGVTWTWKLNVFPLTVSGDGGDAAGVWALKAQTVRISQKLH